MTSKIDFVGLHAHSCVGSPFDALGYPPEHMDYAHSQGMKALALTDHGNMNGMSYQVLHAKKMASEGKEFKPIFGVEAYFIEDLEEWKAEYERISADKKARRQLSKEEAGTNIESEEDTKTQEKSILNKRSHLVLLAQNQTGLNNIYKMVSKSYQPGNFYRFPRIDLKDLESHSEGVIALSACLGGVYGKIFYNRRAEGSESVLEGMRDITKKMMDIFGDRWFGEFQWHAMEDQMELNSYILQIQKEFGFKLVSTADSHYPEPSYWRDRLVYKALGRLNKVADPTELMADMPETVEELGHDLYPKTGDEVWETYKSVSAKFGYTYDDDAVRQSLENTVYIAHELIEDFYPDSTIRLPEFIVPENVAADDLLKEKCNECLNVLYPAGASVDYHKRLERELKVIADRGFSKYFLTMTAIIDLAKDKQLIGPGRGSAAGSLIAYLLGITQIDPIKYGLQFERFMRSDQTDYPDIDTDYEEPMEFKEFLIEEWGPDTVVPISNFNTLQLPSLIKDLSKLYGISFTEANSVTSRMVKEATPKAKKAKGIKSGMYVPTFEEVKAYSDSLKKYLMKYPLIGAHVDRLFGQVRSLSRHAGGVVIGDNLDSYMPLINSKGVVQTPWPEGANVRHLEPMGFIKFDLLGLASLRMIKNAIALILRRHQGNDNPSFADILEFYDKNLHPDAIDLNDQQIYENIYHDGNFAGIFQFAEKGAQRFCRKAKPRNIIDLSAITSIYRPGPLGAKVDKNYVACKSGQRDVYYVNELVKKVTKETYGFLVFQEQIAELAHKLGKNISLEEGNQLRKILIKKAGEKDVKKQRKKEKIFSKFLDGCIDKKVDVRTAEQIWNSFELFSQYGFNKSHAVSYSVLSYQCAWLAHYYPSEWMAAYLSKEMENEKKKAKALAIAKKAGYNIKKIDINESTDVWQISEDGRTLIQPLTNIKGMGAKAVKKILELQPYENIEQLLFDAKLGKKALDVLIRANAVSSLVDDRFTGMKHFWSAVAVDKPTSKKKFNEKIELYADEGDFTKKELIEYVSDLTGVFPVEVIMTDKILEKLESSYIPPIGKWDKVLEVAWLIPRQVLKKKTINGKAYWIVKTIDNQGSQVDIKCWGVSKRDKIELNKPYLVKPEYSEDWGFSVRSVRKQFKLIG